MPTVTKWHDPKTVYESEDGLKVLYLDTPEDLTIIGHLQGHCSASHWPWACEEPRLFYFFTVVGKDLAPHCTVHTKQKKWFKKAHPKDSAPKIPWNPPDPAAYYYNRVTCTECRGYGGHRGDGRPYYYGDLGVKACSRCGGSGVEPVSTKKQDTIPFPTGKTLTPAVIAEAFKKAGKEYVEGEWATQSFESTTYDSIMDYGSTAGWDNLYRVIPKKPDFVTDEQWDVYTKNWKAMKDAYDKKIGFTKIGGRVFKFDSKELIVLSYQSRGDGYSRGGSGGMKYRSVFNEFLIECNKRKKEAKEKEVAVA